jgi:prepilin signal peptidase PulO-like enzyme (type II secretory pathway)
LAGGAFGWTQVAITGRWLGACERDLADQSAAGNVPIGPLPPAAANRSASVGVAAMIVVVGLWWWEVRCLGELPRDASTLAIPFSAVALRWLAHTVLFWFLAAATWIDLRYRVIPDWVTIPGLLIGLVAAWLMPATLLPVGAEVPRAFATPLVVPDVLGWAGPLAQAAAESGWWSAGTPIALLTALALYGLWWVVGTGPDLAGVPEPLPDADAATPSPPAAPPTVGRMRLLVLVGGLVAVAGAWGIGGIRFEALLTALVGAVVAGGVVWATRAGASLALGREAMGLGDVTLMAMVGGWLGWQASVLACFLGVLFGLVHGVAQIVRHRESELPFGPSLCAGTVAVVIGWRPLWEASAASFAETGQLVGIVVAVVTGTALSLWIWSSLGPAARRLALAVIVLLMLVLVAWLLVLQH